MVTKRGGVRHEAQLCKTPQKERLNIAMRAKFISISFTIKGQDLQQIRQELEYISNITGSKSGKSILVHGFMPMDVVKEKGFSADVNHMLKELFPRQIHFYKEGDLQGMRKEMCEFMVANKGTAFIVGGIVDGVAEEYNLYQNNNIPCYTRSLSPIDSGAIAQELEIKQTYGERLAGVSFNPSASGDVDNVKQAAAIFMDAIHDAAGAKDQQSAETSKLENNIWQSATVRALEAQMLAVKGITWK